MNPQFHDDQLSLVSDYYPDGIITQFVPAEEDVGAAENVKARRRRRKSKGGGAGLMRKRKLSEEQLSMLERSFGNEHKLESERKDRLAAELGLDPRQVAVWFQNRRARWKTKKLEEEFSKLKAQLDSAVLDKCRLETQVLKMKEQLSEAEKEIQRLSVSEAGFTSNSPSSSISMDANVELDQHFLAHQFAALGGLDDVFYVPQSHDSHAFQWDDHIFNI